MINPDLLNNSSEEPQADQKTARKEYVITEGPLGQKPLSGSTLSLLFHLREITFSGRDNVSSCQSLTLK